MDTSYLGGLVRHLLSAGAGVLVADGYISSTQSEQLVGAGMTLATIAWSLWQKHQQKAKVALAQNPPLPVAPSAAGSTS